LHEKIASATRIPTPKQDQRRPYWRYDRQCSPKHADEAWSPCQGSLILGAFGAPFRHKVVRTSNRLRLWLWPGCPNIHLHSGIWRMPCCGAALAGPFGWTFCRLADQTPVCLFAWLTVWPFQTLPFRPFDDSVGRLSACMNDRLLACAAICLSACLQIWLVARSPRALGSGVCASWTTASHPPLASRQSQQHQSVHSSLSPFPGPLLPDPRRASIPYRATHLWREPSDHPHPPSRKPRIINAVAWKRSLKRRPDGQVAGVLLAGKPPTPDDISCPHRLSGFRARAPLRRSGNRPVGTVGRICHMAPM